eukprot:SAG22_NODE_429_length_10587_cov_22.842582_9_plen_185_part_00
MRDKSERCLAPGLAAKLIVLRAVLLEERSAGGGELRGEAQGGTNIGSPNIATLRFGAQAVAWAHWAFRRVTRTRYGQVLRPSAAVALPGGGRVGSVIRDQLAMTRRLGEGGPGSIGSAGAPMRLGWGVGPYINKVATRRYPVPGYKRAQCDAQSDRVGACTVGETVVDSPPVYVSGEKAGVNLF